MLKIDVIGTVGEALADDLLHKTVVAIDVLRATTVMTTALEQGCTGIVPVETVTQVKQTQDDGDLLGGERGCKKIAGFDFGNSPFEFMDGRIEGKRLIMTTTNGTRAVNKAHRASHLFAGSLRNAAACAAAALSKDRDIALLCAGTQDVFSLEDGLCAGALIVELRKLAGSSPLAVNDLGLAMEAAYLQSKERLKEVLLACSNGERLTRLGFKEDVGFCAELNASSVVPELSGGVLRKF